MKYSIDNDLHIHSRLSSCSNDPEQTNERILKYAQDEGLKTICVTDHFWDESVEGASEWYSDQNYLHISSGKPLPKKDGIRFLFGCETELNKFLTLGISKERLDSFDFVIIPTTHFHMKGYTLLDYEMTNTKTRATAWVKRFDAVLNMDLPFHKIGIAHLTCNLIAPTREEFLETISLIPQGDLERLFKKAAQVKVGIELNSYDMVYKDSEEDTILRVYRTAKECGCKFYLGSDSHTPAALIKAREHFEKAVEVLQLTEEDKFIL